MSRTGVFAIVLIGLLSCCCVSVFAQTSMVAVSGKVLAAQENEAVDNTTIKVKGTGKVFFSDDTGRFTIMLPNDSRDYEVEISKVGFVTAVRRLSAVKTNDLILLIEKAENLIEEVVVSTGYQRLPKERMTGSFEHVDEKLYNRQIGTDVLSRLDGIMPGVFFDKRGGGETNMIVRGVASLGLTERKPLIVLDNFPFEGDINSINPNDIESATLLKDAAAASIWGARAGNGVLVLTTKKGKLGERWTAGLTANATFVDRPNMYYQPQMSSAEFIEVEKFLFDKGVYNSTLNNTVSRPPVTPVVEWLDKHRNGNVTDTQLQQMLSDWGTRDVRDDLAKYFYRTGFNQQYAFNMRGGGDRSATLFSAGFDRNLSSSVGNSMRRVSLNLQNTFHPLPNMEVALGARYATLQRVNNHLGSIQMVVGRDIYPYADLVDENGNALVVERDYRPSYLQGTEDAGQLLDWRYRPYEEMSLADNVTRSQNILFTAALKYKLTNDLNVDVSYQYEYQPTTGKQHFSPETYYTRNMINRFTQINGDEVVRPVPLGGILDRDYQETNAHSGRGQLNYNKDWAKHAVSALAGMELRDAKNSGYNNRLYGYDDDLLVNSVVNFVERFPIYDNLSSPGSIQYLNQEYGGVQRFVSFFGNASYTHNGKYTVSGSARRDASNLFGVKTNDKWKPLWSVGGAWDVHKESFFKTELLSQLRFRTTYGYSGNVATGYPAVTTLEYRGRSSTARQPYAVVRNAPNPQLRWEKISTFNLGLDFTFKGNSLSGSIEYYRKKASDLLSAVDADPTTGFNSLAMNSAIVRNTGMDINLIGKASLFSRVKWTGNFMISVNENTVLTYLREVSRPSNHVGIGTAVSPIVGQPTYPLVSYRWAGLDPENGDPVGIFSGEPSKDYLKITEESTLDDLVFHGSALPEYYGAFRNTFDWRSFSFSANIMYRAGYFFRRETIDYTTLLRVNTLVGHGDYNERWQQPGDEQYTNVPSMDYPVDSRRNKFYRESEATVERGDHIRLQDVSIAYTFNRGGTKRFFKNLRATFYARNLGIIWRSNKYGLDPDVRGVPLAKSCSLGLNANF